MIHTFRTSEALRCILQNAPRGQNLACPTANFFGSSLPRNAKLWQETLAQRRSRVTLGWWDGLYLGGLVSAAPRGGGSIWEIDHFHLRTSSSTKASPTPVSSTNHGSGSVQYDDHAWPCLDLLEQLVQIVGHRQSQRIFLRMESASPLIDLVRRAGFFPYFEETLWRRDAISPSLDQGRGRGTSPSGAEPWEIMRRDSCTPQEEYSLFQLYGAATPSQVRLALGITFDQWRDARGHSKGGSFPFPGRRLGGIISTGPREWVTVSKGKTVGWLSLQSHRGGVAGEVMVHPDHPNLLRELVGLALTRRGTQRWLVPDYQAAVGDLLRWHGFQEEGCYTMLVKTVAARVTSRGMVPVGA